MAKFQFELPDKSGERTSVFSFPFKEIVGENGRVYRRVDLKEEEDPRQVLSVFDRAGVEVVALGAPAGDIFLYVRQED